jgi:hypothetical protein
VNNTKQSSGPSTSHVHLPKIDLTTFFLSISSAAFMGMGAGMGAGEGGKIDLELARQNIDLLELMQEKTRGNRTPEEDKLIEQLLFETRMRFLEVQKLAGQTANKRN